MAIHGAGVRCWQPASCGKCSGYGSGGYGSGGGGGCSGGGDEGGHSNDGRQPRLARQKAALTVTPTVVHARGRPHRWCHSVQAAADTRPTAPAGSGGQRVKKNTAMSPPHTSSTGLPGPAHRPNKPGQPPGCGLLGLRQMQNSFAWSYRLFARKNSGAVHVPEYASTQNGLLSSSKYLVAPVEDRDKFTSRRCAVVGSALAWGLDARGTVPPRLGHCQQPLLIDPIAAIPCPLGSQSMESPPPRHPSSSTIFRPRVLRDTRQSMTPPAQVRVGGSHGRRRGRHFHIAGAAAPPHDGVPAAATAAIAPPPDPLTPPLPQPQGDPASRPAFHTGRAESRPHTPPQHPPPITTTGMLWSSATYFYFYLASAPCAAGFPSRPPSSEAVCLWSAARVRGGGLPAAGAGHRWACVPRRRRRVDVGR